MLAATSGRTAERPPAARSAALTWSLDIITGVSWESNVFSTADAAEDGLALPYGIELEFGRKSSKAMRWSAGLDANGLAHANGMQHRADDFATSAWGRMQWNLRRKSRVPVHLVLRTTATADRDYVPLRKALVEDPTEDGLARAHRYDANEVRAVFDASWRPKGGKWEWGTGATLRRRDHRVDFENDLLIDSLDHAAWKIDAWVERALTSKLSLRLTLDAARINYDEKFTRSATGGILWGVPQRYESLAQDLALEWRPTPAQRHAWSGMRDIRSDRAAGWDDRAEDGWRYRFVFERAKRWSLRARLSWSRDRWPVARIDYNPFLETRRSWDRAVEAEWTRFLGERWSVSLQGEWQAHRSRTPGFDVDESLVRVLASWHLAGSAREGRAARPDLRSHAGESKARKAVE